MLENGTFVELEKNPIPTVTAAELLGAYAKDEKAAGKKYGTWDAKKELFLKATAREIGERDARFDVKLLTLEPQGGKLKLRVSVAADDVEGLKPGDPILVKVLCTGMGFAAREGELVCSQAVVLKPDAKPSAKGK